VAGSGLLQRDGALHVRLADLVRDEEGGEPREESGEQTADQEGPRP
jgi:hypothetical protein